MDETRLLDRVIFLDAIYLLFALAFTLAGASLLFPHYPAHYCEFCLPTDPRSVPAPGTDLLSSLVGGLLLAIDVSYSASVVLVGVRVLKGRADDMFFGRLAAFGIFGLTAINFFAVAVFSNLIPD